MSENYDLVVVGGGPGGLAAAEIAAANKKRVLIIEKDGWGGTCTHRGCIPTKALLTCSKFYADLKKLKRVGINMTGATIDFAAMKKHREQIVKVAALGAQKILADANVETKLGTGEIISPKEVRFTDSSGKAKAVSAQNISSPGVPCRKYFRESVHLKTFLHLMISFRSIRCRKAFLLSAAALSA